MVSHTNPAIPRPTAGQPLERSLKDLQARLEPQHKFEPFGDGDKTCEKNHVVNVYIKIYIYFQIGFTSLPEAHQNLQFPTAVPSRHSPCDPFMTT